MRSHVDTLIGDASSIDIIGVRSKNTQGQNLHQNWAPSASSLWCQVMKYTALSCSQLYVLLGQIACANSLIAINQSTDQSGAIKQSKIHACMQSANQSIMHSYQQSGKPINQSINPAIHFSRCYRALWFIVGICSCTRGCVQWTSSSNPDKLLTMQSACLALHGLRRRYFCMKGWSQLYQ